MTSKPLTRFLFLFIAMLAANCAWASSVSPVAVLGDNTYSITVKATNKFTRNTQKLLDQAKEAAAQYCAKEGKTLKVVSTTDDKSYYLVGDYAQATLTFKALGASDPELAPVPAADHPKPLPAINADVLTSELTKLDDLRKKGILTDEEFTAAKKRLLDRL